MVGGGTPHRSKNRCPSSSSRSCPSWLVDAWAAIAAASLRVRWASARNAGSLSRARTSSAELPPADFLLMPPGPSGWIARPA